MLAVEAVDVNWQSFDGKTALLLAAAEGHCACMQLLLEHGADVNLSDHMQESPLLAGIVNLLFCMYEIADICLLYVVKYFRQCYILCSNCVCVFFVITVDYSSTPKIFKSLGLFEQVFL